MRVFFQLECRASAAEVRACVRDELRLTPWYGAPSALAEDESQPLSAAVPLGCGCCCAAPTARSALRDDEEELLLEARAPAGAGRGTLSARFEPIGTRSVRVRLELRCDPKGSSARLLAPLTYARMLLAATRLRMRLVNHLAALERHAI